MQRLPKLLKRVYLGGVVDECVLTAIEEGFAYIQAVDISNTIFIDVATNVPLPALGKVGLGSLGMLCKFFDATKGSNYTLNLDQNRLVILAGQHGRLNYLLTQADLIPTTVDDSASMTKLLATCTHEIALTEEKAKDILTYLSMLKLPSVALSYCPPEAVISGGLESEHQFDLSLGTATGDAALPFAVNVHADKLAAVLGVLEWGTPVLHFAAGRPLIVEQDADNLWALVPVNVG